MHKNDSALRWRRLLQFPIRALLLLVPFSALLCLILVQSREIGELKKSIDSLEQQLQAAKTQKFVVFTHNVANVPQRRVRYRPPIDIARYKDAIDRGMIIDSIELQNPFAEQLTLDSFDSKNSAEQ